MRLISLIITFLFFIAFPGFIHAQFTFQEATDINFSYNGKSIPDPLTGGYNNAQFSEIDLNFDNVKDLIVYDRFRGQVRPYINRGIADSVSYYYAPEYADKFPEMRDFLLTADYNNDGKFDLYVGGSTISLYENTSTNGVLSFAFVEQIRSVFQAGRPPIGINPTSINVPGIYDIDGDNDIDLFTNNSSLSIDYHRNLSQENNNNFDLDYERRSPCWGVFFEGLGKNKQDSIFLDTCYRRSFSDRGERLKPKTDKSDHQSKRLKHGFGLTILPFDYDDNGSTDLLIADEGVKGLKLLLNDDSIPPFTESRIYKVIDNFPPNDVTVDLSFPAAYLLDVNNDGKKDLLVTSNQVDGSQFPPFSKENILFYKNVSTNNSYLFELQTDQFFHDQTLDFGRASKPAFIDFNKDGLQDILIGSGGYLEAQSDSQYLGQMILMENIGTPTQPEFEIIDTNYLDISNLSMQITPDLYFDLLSPAIGDIDGDGDSDMLLTRENGKTFLFEDTAAIGSPAAFKFHPQPFQGIEDALLTPISTTLYDIDNNGLLDLIANSTSRTHYFPNFGTATNPIFRFELDSFYWVGGDTMRYHLSEAINYNMLKIGDSLAVNNGSNPNNDPTTALRLTRIDSSNNTLDCINTIPGGVGDSRYDELTTSARMTFFDRWWNFSIGSSSFPSENIFMYRVNGQNQVIIGNNFDGTNFLVRNFTDSLRPLDTVEKIISNFIPNYGYDSYIDGADINNDGFIDLVVGLNTGGIKILYGEQTPLIFQANPNSLLLGSDSGSFANFSINSNLLSWKIEENASWLSLDTDSGSFNATVTATAIANNSTSSIRSESVTISSPPEVPITVTVSQDTVRAIGIKENELNSRFVLYPNPAQNFFTIQLNDETKINDYEVSVYSISGKILSHQTFYGNKKQVIAMEKYPNGVYFVEVKTDRYTSTRKLMINR